MTEELWMEVHDIIKEAVIKDIPKKKKCKKAKWLSKEVLQISEKRREAKAKEKKKDIPIKLRVPKNSKEDKKAILKDQCRKSGKQQNGKD